MSDMKKIIQYLIEICSNIDVNESDESEDTIRLWRYKKGIDVILGENEEKKFNDAIEELYTDDYIKSNFPRPCIRNEFEGIISEALQTPEEDRSDFIAKEIGDLRSKLKKEIKKLTFIIPIFNLKIKNDFSIGNVTFKKIDDVRSKIEEICNPNKDNKIHESLENRCKYLESVCAEVNVEGVPLFAKNTAFYHVRLAGNCLKLYTSPFDPSWGLKGEILRPEFRMIFFYENEAKSSPYWRISNELVSSSDEYELNSDRINVMNEYYFKELDEILKKYRHYDLETRLLTSIYWFGESLNTPLIKQDDTIYKKKKHKHRNLEYFGFGERLIKLFTALEAILIFDKNDPITSSISERTPLLLSNDHDRRREFKTYLERLYETRSQIVHYGNTAVSQQDILKLTEIVRSVIIALLKMKKTHHEFKKIDNLKEYFDELKSLLG